MTTEVPIRYTAAADGVHLAYQVVGLGPPDLVLVHGWVTNLELFWEHPLPAGMLARLASFARVIHFDKRGTGLSDRVAADRLPSLEQRMDDVRAVMDAAGSERAFLVGHSEGGPLAVLFAATYPERVGGLVVYGGYAARRPHDDYPWAPSPEARQAFYDSIEREWGGVADLEVIAPSLAADPSFRRWWGRYQRSSASPAAAVALARMNTRADVRRVLPAVSVPTLVLHRRDDRDAAVEGGRWLAAQVPGARFVELAGEDHMLMAHPDDVVDEIEEFVTGTRPGPMPDRVLTTVLFTDIVDSTGRAAALGDAEWRRVLDRHDAAVRAQLGRFRGQEVVSTGDGFLATFDGPARAVRCALAVVGAAAELGMEVRAGVHTGEVERRGDNVGGLGVHIGARVAATAGAGEVLVSSTVAGLVAGSGLEFADRGRHRLRGVPGEWQLYAAGDPRGVPA
ncbi:MAG TPA: adenylate/guanylate cyclase domain-containing protein [Jiangellales bacterium]|nr:adenylate/guanylate cyclase domain-containing protein [Jiangellales bacterium]